MTLESMTSVLATIPPWDELLAVDFEERVRRGYGHTLHEILQQVFVWPRSGAKGLTAQRELQAAMRREGEQTLRPILLTGSGSSQYVAECVAPILQAQLDVVARAVPASLLLTHPASYVTAADPPLVISFGRSGDSPESTAVIDLLLSRYPTCRHVPITCNAQGRLATAYVSDRRVTPIVLDERTNDRSLVMTSSFTNLVVAGRALAAPPEAAYREPMILYALSLCARGIFGQYAGALAHAARRPFRSACYLASGPSLGAAREAALKMLEMSGGAVATIAETPLGLRHGPMAALRPDSLVVAGLRESSLAHGYTVDVLREIRRKGLAGSIVIVGRGIPKEFTQEPDIAVSVSVDLEGFDLEALMYVVVGQILAFFRCIAEGLRPDAPSPDGVISRVVPQFRLY